MLAGVILAVHHPSAVHPLHRPRQLHRQPDQSIHREWLRQSCEACATSIGQDDRSRVRWRLRQLRDPSHTAQPLQHGQLMPQSAFRVRPQRLLADDRALREEQPGHARVLALVHDLGADRRIRARWHPA
jgi:hypothetical protein